MSVKLIFVLFIFLICILVYFKYKNKEKSFVLMIATALITTIICNVILPSDVSLFEIFSKESNIINEINPYEEINKQNMTEENNNETEAVNINIIKNEVETSSYSENVTEYDNNEIQQEEQQSGKSGSWITLGIRRKQLSDVITELEQELDKIPPEDEVKTKIINDLDLS